MNKRVIAAVLGAAALAVPAAAAADPGRGKGDAKPAGGKVVKTNGKGTAKPAKKVTFVFKGSFTADGAVQVSSGNAQVRKGGFVGQTVTFDFAGAKVVVADSNADHTADLADVKVGDVVLVKARLRRGATYAAPADDQTLQRPVANQLIDKTNAPVADQEPIEPQDGAKG